MYGDDVEKLSKTNKFVSDKDFTGTFQSRIRDGPVQFEMAVEEDPFALNQLLREAKRAK